ncbi:sugar phosphate isomerase/epimerase family protein [Paenibacillus elgii]|uniref:sugar phosphate isomerase/epimerase family protein n=1 Tax=Paenibacillus elgii TaxID=189691 RepID=UPI000FDB774C|nr:TIM barrel protein [Paenibacillus elgii]NEN84784.1 sugar phosphate isomerase/epimerase [Paenibacillus elgii]
MSRRRLQIGMWHAFSEEDMERFGSDAIGGIEICQYRDNESLWYTTKVCKEKGLSFGIHTPVFGGQPYKLPRITSIDREEREEALLHVESEVRIAAEYGADYILFHYPFVPIFPWETKQVFANMPKPEERYEADQLDAAQLKDISLRLFDTLCGLQHRYGQRIVLEHDFCGEHEELLTTMFREHPEIGLVVDTSRLDISAKAFHNVEPLRWLEAVAPYVYLVHYSNVRYEADRFIHHLPVLPEHDDDDRFGDAYAYLAYLAQRNERFHVTFEHKANLIDRNRLLELYARTERLLQTSMKKSNPVPSE